MEERRTLDFKDPEHQMLLQHLISSRPDIRLAAEPGKPYKPDPV